MKHKSIRVLLVVALCISIILNIYFIITKDSSSFTGIWHGSVHTDTTVTLIIEQKGDTVSGTLSSTTIGASSTVEFSQPIKYDSFSVPIGLKEDGVPADYLVEFPTFKAVRNSSGGVVALLYGEKVLKRKGIRWR